MAAPKGNQNARKARDWENALRRALAQYEDPAADIRPGEALSRAAEKVVKAAVNGDWDAIEHIANRLDGKPTEHVEAHHVHTAGELSDGEILARLERIRAAERAAEAAPGPQNTAGVH